MKRIGFSVLVAGFLISCNSGLQNQDNLSGENPDHGSGYLDTSREGSNNKNSVGDVVFKGYVYNLVRSPITQRIWLDRNLGAKKVCETKEDEKCYGDYYQWGRKANGHEKKYSDVVDANYEPIKEDVDSDGSFATWKSDWKEVRDDTLWQGIDGKNNPCPPNFRVPTIAEIMAETKEVDRTKFPEQVLNGQYSNLKNFLKLPNNGYRKHTTRDGIIEIEGYSGGVWSSTTSSGFSYKFDFYPGGASQTPVARSNGYGVRCIKDYKKSKDFIVLATFPKESDKDISVAPKFEIVFSHPISSQSLSRTNFTISRISDGKESGISAIPQKENDNHTVTFSLSRYNSNASGGLEPNTDYKLVIHKDGVKDTQDNALQKDFVIKFRTKKD